MHHNQQSHSNSSQVNVYDFPGLKQKTRRVAANNNSVPMFGNILKHVAVMGAAFGLLYSLQAALF